MTRWDLEQKNTGYRVEFHFKNESGALLKTKKPILEVIGPNFVCVTTVVSEISGELSITVFNGFNDMNKINQQINAFPISLGVVLDSSGLHFTLHSTK